MESAKPATSVRAHKAYAMSYISEHYMPVYVRILEDLLLIWLPIKAARFVLKSWRITFVVISSQYQWGLGRGRCENLSGRSHEGWQAVWKVREQMRR